MDQLLDCVGEIFVAREQLSRLLKDDDRADVHSSLDKLTSRIREMHDQILSDRLMPLRTLTDRYPRIVRDLARSLNKDIVLTIDGESLELDKTLLDALDNPLLHLLRNSVDHGIGTPSQRLAQGKTASGHISIRARRNRDSVYIVVEDDGDGFNTEAIQHKAIRNGLITAQQAATLSERDTFALSLLPGFSTKDEVNDLSGRGVGLDVVRQRVESMGGSIDITSNQGQGSQFTLSLPTTLVIAPVLLVEASQCVFAMPSTNIVGIRAGVENSEPCNITFRSSTLNVTNLDQILHLSKEPTTRRHSAEIVLLEDNEQFHGIGVDKVLGYQEVVVKPLGDPLQRISHFSGATILGDGLTVLIVDILRVLRLGAAA
ncbi:MAG: ATP-binding protein [Myxococcota bacterium]